MRLVGEDGERNLFVGEGFQEGEDAGKELGAVAPGGRVFAEEVLVEGVDAGVGILWCGPATEHPGSVADEVANCGFVVRGQAFCGQSTVQGRGDAGEGFDEGPVEVEDESAGHGGKVSGEPLGRRW